MNLLNKNINFFKSVSFKLFLIFFIIYSFLTSSFTSSGNEWSRFLLLKSIVENHSLQLDRFSELSYLRESEWTDTVKINGHIYSNKPPGFLLLTAPGYIITKLFRLDTIAPYDKGSPHIQQWSLTVLSTGIISAFLVVLIYQLSSLFVSNKTAIITAIIFGIGTQAFPWSTSFFNHQIDAFLVFLSFYSIYKFSQKEPLKWTLIAAVALSIEILSNYAGILIVLLLLIYAFLKLKPTKYFIYFLLFIIIAYIGLLIYNYMCTNNFFTTPATIWLKERNMVVFNIFVPKIINLWKQLFSLDDGLFIYNPILILFIPAIIIMYKYKKKEALFILFLVVSYTIAFTVFFDYSNHRYFVLLMPFMILPLSYLFLNKIWFRFGGLPLFLLSSFNMVIWTLTTTHINPPYKISHGIERIINGYLGGLFCFFQYAIGDRNRYPFRLEGYLGIIFLFFMFFLLYRLYKNVSKEVL